MPFRKSWLIVLLVFPLLMSAQDNWILFTPKDQFFEVEVPYTMQDGQKKIMTEVGELKPTTWICKGKAKDTNHLYLLSYVDYPEATFHADSTALVTEFLKISMESHIKDLGGELVYQSDSPLQCLELRDNIRHEAPLWCSDDRNAPYRPAVLP